MRLLLLLAAGAGLASAQCYVFSGPGITYSMNISGVTSVANVLQSTEFIVQQVSTLTYGGKTYVAASGPGNVSIESDGGESTFQSAALQLLTIPVWQVGVFLVGDVTLQLGSLPASLPPVSSWQVQPPFLSVSINGVLPETKFTITSVGSCGSGGGGGAGTSLGQLLGNPSSQPGDCGCDDPISVATGNVFEEIADYRTAGMNRLAFVRYYNSEAGASVKTFATSLGTNWRSNYDRYLNIGATSVIAERPDGMQATFTLNGTTWTTDADIDLTLTNSGSTWTLTDQNDTVETYTASSSGEGVLQSIKARNGYTQTLGYSSGGQLSNVTDSFNRQLMLAYSNGLLHTVTTPDGLVLTYGFSSGTPNLLTSIGYSTTPATSQTYVYGNSAFPAALTAVVDENGATYRSWTYDSNGRALTNQKAGGADLFTFTYDDTDGSRTVTGPLGQQATYRFTTLQSVPKVSEIDFTGTSTTAAGKMSFTYDTNGYLASRTDFNGNVTTLVNDVHGQPVSITEAAGSSLARTTMIAYLPNFHLPQQIVAPTLTTTYTYDSSGEPLTVAETDTTTNTVPYSTAGQTRTWTFTWSNFLLATVKSPRTDVSAATKLDYDASGALTSFTNALNQTVQITQHAPGGLPLAITSPNNVNATITYDARQRRLTWTVATSAGPLTVKFGYDAAEDLTTWTMPDGSGLTGAYDQAHRLIGITDFLGNSVDYTLDAGGDAISTVAKDSGGNTQFKRTTTYDAQGRPLQMTGGAGQSTTYAYDLNGNMMSMADGLNHKWQQTFTALNTLLKSTDPAGNPTAFTYDPLSRPATITDPNGANTTYAYDGFGDRIQEVSPTSGATIYRYDAAGNLTQRVDARGVVTNYAYDALNRRISVTYPGDSSENVTYTYDQGPLGIGRLTSVTDAVGTLSRTYDERGNVLSETRKTAGATLTTSYTYDGASRVLSITYPSKWTVNYTRDKMGNVTGAIAVAPGGGTTKPLLSAVSRQPFGPVSALTYGNGIAETRTLDADYRVTKIASSVQNLSYGYDAANDILAISDGKTTGNSQTLTYDSLDRLDGASGPYGTISYSYDANGNRTSEASAAASDGLGAITAFTYNQEGRLSGAANGSQLLAQYAYDGFGQRLVRMGAATGTTLYQYGQGNLLEETDGQGNAQVDYIYVGSQPVATIEPGGTMYFLHDDLLGTPLAATSSSQSVAWSTTYQPFGLIGTAPSTIVEDLRLPGQESDIPTGLYHNGLRDYVPATGQYIESDPVGLWGGFNRYAYAEGNPLALTDPTGTSVSDTWNQVQTFCNMGASCSFMDKAKMAYNLMTAPTTPYVPPTPPPPPPTYFNPDGTLTSFGQAVMWCGAIVKGGGSTSQCSPQAAPIVNAAFVQQGLDQLSQLDQSFVNQVLYPTLEKTVSDVGDVLTVWNSGTPYGTELTEGAETVIDFIEGYTQGTESVNPVPSSNSKSQLIGIETKDLLQALGVVPICPKAAAAAAANNE
jgi:RHS repeat-associated protein